jgi:glycerophosphoryl diester phosphodiesterase
MPHPAVAAERPLVFAHRGGAALAPENTLAAFDRAIAMGADGLELDVRLARDGVVVVHHDARLDRTTDGSGPIAARTSGELASVDAGARFAVNGAWPFRGQGIGIPTLAQVLERYPGARLIIELKDEAEALARAAIADVTRAGADRRVSLGSFSRRAIAAVRRLAPHLATGAMRSEVRMALYRSRCRLPPRRACYQAFQIPERSGGTTIVSPRFVADATRADVVVQVWTVDDPSDMRRLIAWGVLGIITDRPDVGVAVVRDTLGEKTLP